MRRCVRCNIAMVENCGIKVKGAAYGLVLTDDKTNGGVEEWSSLKWLSAPNVERYPFTWRM